MSRRNLCLKHGIVNSFYSDGCIGGNVDGFSAISDRKYVRVGATHAAVYYNTTVAIQVCVLRKFSIGDGSYTDNNDVCGFGSAVGQTDTGNSVSLSENLVDASIEVEHYAGGGHAVSDKITC